MTRPQVDATDRWFLQIKGQIIGPVPADKVLARLLNGELTVMSRVSQDRTNWRAICNTAVFEELVNERIRAYTGKSEIVGQFGPNHHDDTPFESSQVNFDIVKTNAVEGISEQLDHARQLEELTANIQKLNHLRKEIIQNKQTVTVEKESNDDESHPEDQNIFIPKTQKSSGFSQFLTRMRSGDVRSRRLAVGSLVLLVGGLLSSVAYYGYETYFPNGTHNAQTAGQHESGYAEATAQLEKEKGLTPPNPEELLQMADAHLKSKRPRESQELSRQVLAMNVGKEIKAQAHALVAAAAAQMGQTDVAISEYAQAIEAHEMQSSLHNLGVLKLKTGNAVEAERYLIKAVQVAPPHSVSRSMSLLALFEAARSIDEAEAKNSVSDQSAGQLGAQNTHLSAVSPFITEELKTANALRSRLLLAQLYTEHAKALRAGLMPSAQSGFQLAAVDFIDHPLKLDLQNSSGQTASVEDAVPLADDLDDQFANWQTLVHRCATIYKQPPINAFTAAVYAACLSRSHGAASALPFAKYANDLNANDPVFGGLYSSLLVLTGQPDSAKDLLAKHPEFIDHSKQAKAVAAALNTAPQNSEAIPVLEPMTEEERQPATAK